MKFSIITPSYNQGSYIERTIKSIHAQEGDFELEHLVMDGGSSDGTLAVLRRYEDRLRWVSGQDEGQSDALNKGFTDTTGDVIAWLNSDDLYLPGTLQAVAHAYQTQPFDWCFGNCSNMDEQDNEIRPSITRYKRRQALSYSYRHLLRRNFISQPATFFSRAAFERAGLIELNLHFAMDYDYWLRLGRQSDPVYIDRTLASFRCYSQSKTGALYRKSAWEAYNIARRHARSEERVDLLYHFAHVIILGVMYPFL
ncbi:MAG: glycosyltransferase [Lentisphaerae bacterium]|nr:glycosyltransferase [Lentisphaerota bacterium]